MKFGSDAQRRAVFSNINRFSAGSLDSNMLVHFPKTHGFARVSPRDEMELRARRAKLMIEVSGLEPMIENKARRHEIIKELNNIDDVLEAV